MIVDCAVYEDGHRQDGVRLEDACEAARGHNAFVWVGLHEPTPQEFEAVRREFDLHDLAVEDAIKAHQRPKLEVYGESLFLVLRPAAYLEASEEIEFGEILLFIGDGFIVSVRHGQAGALAEVRRETERDPGRLRCGPGAVLHAVADRVVDDYFPVVRALEDDIEEVEREVFAPDRTSPAERIYTLKRETLEFHRAVAPLVDPLDRLARGHFDFVPEELRSYFRDVHDHAVRITEQVEAFRELLTSVLAANLTQVSVKQNEDTRKITAWAAILVVPTIVTGVYGMNFDHMPELHWSFGYPFAIAVMVAICLALWQVFRRAGWL